MLKFKNKRLKKVNLLVEKRKKFKSLRVLNETILLKQLKKQKKHFSLKSKTTVNPRSHLVSRVKKKKPVNLTARNKSGIISMSFKQVEQKFIGHIMRKGLRSKALTIWMRLLLLLKMHFYKSPITISVASVIMSALRILRPVVILKKRKIAGTVYQIPYFVQNSTRDNAMLIAIRWFLECVEQRIEKDPAVCLYKEFIDVLKKQGLAYKKKMDIYNSAVKNRIYTRFLFAKSRKKRKL
jgi:ribosomal protein S7